MIEDVAVGHPLAGPLVECHQQSRNRAVVSIGILTVSFHAIGRRGAPRSSTGRKK
jgi:hypothetical protein